MECIKQFKGTSYMCTLEKGHKGHHIAHRDKRHRKQDIIMMWPNEDE